MIYDFFFAKEKVLVWKKFEINCQYDSIIALNCLHVH